MANIKHTPGPWKSDLEMEFGECDWKIQISPESKCAVAYAWGSNKNQVRANARLIEEAPEMCRLIYRILDELTPDQFDQLSAKTQDDLIRCVKKIDGDQPQQERADDAQGN